MVSRNVGCFCLSGADIQQYSRLLPGLSCLSTSSIATIVHKCSLYVFIYQVYINEYVRVPMLGFGYQHSNSESKRSYLAKIHLNKRGSVSKTPMLSFGARFWFFFFLIEDVNIIVTHLLLCPRPCSLGP